MSTLFSTISRVIEQRMVHLWPSEARQALTRVLYEVYNADGDFSEDEQAEFQAFVRRLKTDPDALHALDLQAAFHLLTEDPARQRVTYAWIAAALFANRAYKPSERAFVDRIIQRYGLDEALLKAEIQRVQTRLVEEDLQEILGKE